MTKDFTHFHVSKALFLGTTMFLTSVSEMSANPSVELLRPTGPSTAVTSPQQAKQTIKGVVQDAFGPIAGANVIEKGTTNGTITDMDGNFTLDVAPNSILVITFIGYKEQQLPVNNQKTFNIKLQKTTKHWDEVVVVGYGTQKKAKHVRIP